MYIAVPTYDDTSKSWSSTEFETRESFVDFMWSLFKEPGKYEFDETSLKFNEQARLFNNNKVYCYAPMRSKDYITYWDDQKEKCRKGIIVKNKKNTWYLSRDYYMWVNFLPIYNKEISKFGFVDIRDTQYHIALYEEIGKHTYKHALILKKRQIASSYYHGGKMINYFWFEEGSINKMAGSLKDYIGEKGTWRFLEEYRNFLNSYTAWYRPCTPDKIFNWEQKIEINQGGRKRDIGLKSVITGLILDKDPTNGVGGPCVLKGTKILMHNGLTKPVETITLNDLVCGADGKPKTINNLFSGNTEMFEVSQSKGNNYTVTGDHILYFWEKDKKTYRKIKAKDFNNLSKDRKRFLKGIKFNGIEGTKIDLLIDPYYLGLYLGDGCKYDYKIIINKTKDIEIWDYIHNLAKNLKYEISTKNKNKYREDYQEDMWDVSLSSGWKIKTGLPSMNTLFSTFNLENKHIPEIYFNSSINQRLSLLAGIIDTDGYYSEIKNRYELHVKEETLKNDITRLCMSVGLDCHSYFIEENNLTSTVVNNATSGYRLRITGEITKIPCLLPRKKAIKNGIKSINRYSTINVTPIGKGDYYGFECEDNLFILQDGTITHNCTFFFHEEAGIAPKMNETLEYLLPAMRSGMMYTGQFVVAGSVGSLTQCEPLREMLMMPDSKDILAVETNLLDDKGTKGMCGLFIPEQWSMLPCIDKYGNSLVEEALNMIKEERVQWKKDLKPDDYQLRISQHPTNIEEAFASRKAAKFNPSLVVSQIRRIEDGDYPKEFLELTRDENNIITAKESKKIPISEFPISAKTENKEGVLVVWERPIKDPQFGQYYASIDPVAEGKAEFVDNKLYTPSGPKRIGDIKIGDKVIGSNGESINVTGVFPQGKKELYRVFFNDGMSLLVCKDHLWSVSSNGGEKINNHIISTDKFLDENLEIEFNGIGRNTRKIYKTKSYFKNNKGGCKWKIPIVAPINFSEYEYKKVPLDSYFLGLMLGDGGITTRGLRYSSVDLELIEYIKTILPSDITIKYITGCDYRISTTKSRNSITKILRELNLMGKGSHTKFIPDIYKYSNIENRLSILQGLMDTDGYCGNHGSEYYSVSKQLATDVVEIVQSLGGLAKIRKKTKKGKGCGYIYVVRIILPKQFNPFKIQRKSSIYYSSYNFTRYITDIKFEKIDEAVCISVDSPDNLYVTEHAIVTHNTTTSDSLCSIYIYKTSREITKHKTDGTIEQHIEKDGIVASWCGRFDDLKKTHERLELIIEWYNAWTVVENNISLFIQYMIEKRKQKYLVPKSQILFLKELQSNVNVFQEYGWRNVSTLFKTNLISYAQQFIEEELDHKTKPDGTIVQITYGIERIPDIMLLKEMQAYRDGLNVDRLVAFCALIAFAKVQQSNRGVSKSVENEDDNLQKSKNYTKLKVNPFRNIGTGKTINPLYKKSQNPFKNLK